MKLDLLLEQHKMDNNNYSLDENFGDSYLLKHNYFYRKIRELSLKHGYSYVVDDNIKYITLPLSQLDSILISKKLPYFNNVEPIESLVRNCKGMLSWEHVSENLYQNHVFHESCHGVARSLAIKLRQSDEFITDNKFKAIVILLEESFANSCELLGISDVTTPVHRIFYEHNSYFTMFDDKTNIRNAIEGFGRTEFFKFILLSYLYSNFLNEHFNDSDLALCIELAFQKNIPTDPKQIKVLRSLAKNTFALNPQFRFVTTSLYFKMNGINADAEEVCQFNPFVFIKQRPELLKFIELLAKCFE